MYDVHVGDMQDKLRVLSKGLDTALEKLTVLEHALRVQKFSQQHDVAEQIANSATALDLLTT